MCHAYLFLSSSSSTGPMQLHKGNITINTSNFTISITLIEMFIPVLCNPTSCLISWRDMNDTDTQCHNLCAFCHITQCINISFKSTFIILKQPSFTSVPVKLKKKWSSENINAILGKLLIVLRTRTKVYRIVDCWNPDT